MASFASMRNELIATSVFLHKDKGVKAYGACCMADLLSVDAPDAPYTYHPRTPCKAILYTRRSLRTLMATPWTLRSFFHSSFIWSQGTQRALLRPICPLVMFTFSCQKRYACVRLTTCRWAACWSLQGLLYSLQAQPPHDCRGVHG